MICVFVQLFYFFDESFCFGFIFYMPGISYKYGIFEFFLSYARAFQGFIIIQCFTLIISLLIIFILEALKFYSRAPGEHYNIFEQFYAALWLAASQALRLYFLFRSFKDQDSTKYTH